MPRKKKLKPYTSASLATSRRLVAAGPLHEQQAILLDIESRFKGIQNVLPHYHRGSPESKRLAAEAAELYKLYGQHLEALPDGDLKNTMTIRYVNGGLYSKSY